MTDLELLELAAKAIGEQFHSDHITVGGKQFEWVEWNPLTDDGDALRLAVRLKMDVVLCDDDSVVVACWIGDADVANLTEKSTDSQDIYGATRRAIVRAAAEIGKRGA